MKHKDMTIEEILHGEIVQDDCPQDNNDVIECGHFDLGTNQLFEASVPHNQLYKTYYYEKHNAHNSQNGQMHFHIYQENKDQVLFSFNIDGSLHDKKAPANGGLSKGMIQALCKLKVSVENIPQQYLSPGALQWVKEYIKSHSV